MDAKGAARRWAVYDVAPRPARSLGGEPAAQWDVRALVSTCRRDR